MLLTDSSRPPASRGRCSDTNLVRLCQPAETSEPPSAWSKPSAASTTAFFRRCRAMPLAPKRFRLPAYPDTQTFATSLSCSRSLTGAADSLVLCFPEYERGIDAEPTTRVAPERLAACGRRRFSFCSSCVAVSRMRCCRRRAVKEVLRFFAALSWLLSTAELRQLSSKSVLLCHLSVSSVPSASFSSLHLIPRNCAGITHFHARTFVTKLARKRQEALLVHRTKTRNEEGRIAEEGEGKLDTGWLVNDVSNMGNRGARGDKSEAGASDGRQRGTDEQLGNGMRRRMYCLVLLFVYRWRGVVHADHHSDCEGAESAARAAEALGSLPDDDDADDGGDAGPPLAGM